MRNSSGWPFLNVDIFMLYVFDESKAGFLCILILIMVITRTSSSSTLIRAFTSALIQLVEWEIFMIGYIGLGKLSVVLSHVVTLQSDIHIR